MGGGILVYRFFVKRRKEKGRVLSLVAKIKEACSKPRCPNPFAVYDNHVGKSTKKKRDSLVSNDASLSHLPPFEELYKYLLTGFSPLRYFHFLLVLFLFNITHYLIKE